MLLERYCSINSVRTGALGQSQQAEPTSAQVAGKKKGMKMENRGAFLPLLPAGKLAVESEGSRGVGHYRRRG